MRRPFYWAIVLALCLTAVAGCSNDEKPVSEAQFKTLLTVEDINDLLDEEVALETTLNDIKRSATDTSPSAVASVDRAYALIFNAEDAQRGLTLTLTDYDSEKTAREKYEEIKAGTGPLLFSDTSQVIGDASVQVTLDGRGIGSIIMFIAGDKNISLHTTLNAPMDPLIGLDDLEKLAVIVEERLP